MSLSYHVAKMFKICIAHVSKQTSSFAKEQRFSNYVRVKTMYDIFLHLLLWVINVPKVIRIYHFFHVYAIKSSTSNVFTTIKSKSKDWLARRNVWRYQRGNQTPYIEEEQTTQWPKEKVQKDKQRSTKHTHKANDRVTRTPLKNRSELGFSGRVSNQYLSPLKLWVQIPLMTNCY